MITFKQFLYEKILFKNKKVKPRFRNSIVGLKAVINPSLSEVKNEDFFDARGLIRMNGDLILVNSGTNLIHVDIFSVLSIVFSDISKAGGRAIHSFEDIKVEGALAVQRESDTNKIFLGESFSSSIVNDLDITLLLDKAKKKTPSFKFIQKKTTLKF